MAVITTFGVDPSTRDFGWCLSRGGARIASGTWHLQPPRQSTLPLHERLMHLSEHLENVGDLPCLGGGGIDVVAIETPMGRHIGPLGKQYQVIGVIKLWAVRLSSRPEILECTPTELKKWASGRGAAGKFEMLRACSEMLGYTAGDDDEAEACLIAAWGHERVALERAS